MTELEQALGETESAVNETLDSLLPRPEGIEGRVAEAMRYAALSGGKRLRPFLVVASARLFDVPMRAALRAAAAVEMVHCYSLVHDDLPAMDDDALRRGRPTCHVAFDEATAILAGDALLTLAFEVLSAPDTHADAAVRCELARAAAAAAGVAGMVGGQMIDLLAEGRALDVGEVTHLQSLKTGALIAFSCEAGAILGGAAPEAREERGVGNIVNAPLPAGSTGAVFRAAMQSEVLPALSAFKPDFVFISAGFDAHAADPLAGLRLDDDDFAWATEEIAAIAAECCAGRLVSTLEGGYNLDALASACAAHVGVLMAA